MIFPRTGLQLVLIKSTSRKKEKNSISRLRLKILFHPNSGTYFLLRIHSRISYYTSKAEENGRKAQNTKTQKKRKNFATTTLANVWKKMLRLRLIPYQNLVFVLLQHKTKFIFNPRSTSCTNFLHLHLTRRIKSTKRRTELPTTMANRLHVKHANEKNSRMEQL